MRLHHAAAPLSLVALLAACGDSLIDHTNTTVRDQQQNTTCGPNLVQCGTECRSQVVGDPGWVCGKSCTPCAGVPPPNSTLSCTPVGDGGHDGVCGFACSPGSLGTLAGCSLPSLVAAGGQFSCATADNGEVHCWGANDQGQLGPGVVGTSRATSSKVQFAPLVGVSLLAAGPAHVCAAVGATVYCWGDATGWGGTVSSATPVEVPELAGVSTLVAGARHTCGIAGGLVKCAGQQVDGGGSPTFSATVLELAAGDSFTCALLNGAVPSVQCWGANDHGQSTGTGSAGSAFGTPATIPLSPAAGVVLTHVAAGATHACATTSGSKPTDPVIYCWGDDGSHQLGVSGGGGSAEVPIKSNMNKPIATSPTVIDAGGVTTCAVKNDAGNFIQCWGGDATVAGPAILGELNDMSPSLDPPGRFSVGGDHACIVDKTGKLACWGHGLQGQLGDGNGADSQGPVLVQDR